MGGADAVRVGGGALWEIKEESTDIGLVVRVCKYDV